MTPERMEELRHAFGKHTLIRFSMQGKTRKLKRYPVDYLRLCRDLKQQALASGQWTYGCKYDPNAVSKRANDKQEGCVAVYNPIGYGVVWHTRMTISVGKLNHLVALTLVNMHNGLAAGLPLPGRSQCLKNVTSALRPPVERGKYTTDNEWSLVVQERRDGQEYLQRSWEHWVLKHLDAKVNKLLDSLPAP